MVFLVVDGFKPTREQTVGVSLKQSVADKMCDDIRQEYLKCGKIPRECIEDVIKVISFNENTAYVGGKTLAYMDDKAVFALS